MSAPARIQLSRRKGFRLPDDAVNCARPGPLGNPFVAGKNGVRDRNAAVRLYLSLVQGLVCVSCGPPIEEQRKAVHALRAQIDALKGKSCACWCALPKPGEPDICHAAVILALANHDDPRDRVRALKPILDGVFPEISA